MNKLVKDFQLKYPKLCKAMQECSHHYSDTELNPYHLEGDVWSHTMMICNQAVNQNKNVQIAALLHDIGKPFTRKENHEKKRVSFYGHESMSAFLALDVLKDMELSDSDIVRIFQLISLHTEPFKLEEKQLLERMVKNRYLYLDLISLNQADSLGRFHEQDSELITTKATDCPYEEKNKEATITMLIGLPCSGKSTYCKDTSEAILSRDNIVESLGVGSNYKEKWDSVDQKAVDKQFQQELKDLVKSRVNFIVDRTNLSRKSRRSILNQIPSCYKKKAVVFLTGLSEIEGRNLAREGKTIPDDVIENMVKGFYPPLFDEFEEIEWKLS